MRCVAFLNPRPAGKTACVAVLGFELSRTGARVLCVDLSPNCALTRIYSATDVGPKNTANLIMGAYGSVTEIARPARDFIARKEKGRKRAYDPDRLHLAPGSPTLYEVAVRSYMEGRPADVLARALDGADYDWALMDTGPGLDTLVAKALMAADAYVVPVRVDDADWRVGLDSLFHVVNLLGTGLRHRVVPCLGAILTEHYGRIAEARDRRDELGEYLADSRMAPFRAGLRPGAIEAAAAGRMPWEVEERTYSSRHAWGVNTYALADEFVRRAETVVG